MSDLQVVARLLLNAQFPMNNPSEVNKKPLEQKILFPELMDEMLEVAEYYVKLEEQQRKVWQLEMERCRDFNYWRKKYWKDGKI